MRTNEAETELNYSCLRTETKAAVRNNKKQWHINSRVNYSKLKNKARGRF